nr:15556_t:CDS:2 [Entrophospora candida]
MKCQEDLKQYIEVLNLFSDPPNVKMQDKISLGILYNICYYLSPQDISMLTCVCKHFKIMLGEKYFPMARIIWKHSRETFTPFKHMGPPFDLTEKQFAMILNFQKGCQICKRKDKTIQIYWVGFIRSCKDCLQYMAKSRKQLLDCEWARNECVVDCTPYVIPYLDTTKTKYYLPTQIMKTQAEYDSLLFSNQNLWVAKKKLEAEQFVDQSLILFEWVNECLKVQHNIQLTNLGFIISRVCNKFPSYTMDQFEKHSLTLKVKKLISSNPCIKIDWQKFEIELIDSIESYNDND